MLNLSWYYESPIDFEHKHYLLLDYVMEIDQSYSSLKLSPYLLWTERLVYDMSVFLINYNSFNLQMKKDIDYMQGLEIIYKEVKQLDGIKEILEIVDYSKPILDSKIMMGYKLFEKYPQILY